MTAIKKLYAREILDSRGHPTLEVDVILEEGSFGRFSAPSGASTGFFEAHERRDQDLKRYHGKGVLDAKNAVLAEIADSIVNVHFETQENLDQALILLDGTANKSRLGANAILCVSFAYAKAKALSKGIPFFKHIEDLFTPLSAQRSYLLPRPMMNVINGGVHADNQLDIQEFMIIPWRATSFSSALQIGVEIFHSLRSDLKQKGYNVNVGDEGGFAPQLTSANQALDFLLNATLKAGFMPGEDVRFALDVAANEIFKNDHYTLDGQNYNADQLMVYYENLCKNYPIASIEDGLQEDDFDAWARWTQSAFSKLQLVGDDLFVTNPKRLQKGIEKKAANAILIKPNQIGTLSETLQTICLAKQAGYGIVISHRSGETEDTSIAHLAVGTRAGQIKTGSLCRTDRVAKYNELLRIEEILQTQALYGDV